MINVYPAIEPFHVFLLQTESRHEVYVEESGNPNGIPVVFLHGGPCSGTRPDHRRFFNPDQYRIILFDQRGCGRSLPFGETENNTTQDLIEDMERIRTKLEISRWLVFGGSWGGALGLLYAQHHPDKVLGLIIRGVFLARQEDMEWFAGKGVNRIYPEQWEQLTGSVTISSPWELVEVLWQTVNGSDQATAYLAAAAWQAWNAQVAVGRAFAGPKEVDCEIDKGGAIKQVRMELHYALHHYFISENQILAHCGEIRHIPAIIIHGRYDLVCPLDSGLRLHRALPDSEWIVLPNAGHIAQHEEMIDALVSATDKFIGLIAK